MKLVSTPSSSFCLFTFISHMVQMKQTSSSTSSHKTFIFISHMVQMKLPYQRSTGSSELNLYPTWFRWNILEIWYGRRYLTYLYPTWFRWNFITKLFMSTDTPYLYPTWFRWNAMLNFTYDWNSCIYIPHGSDETFPSALETGIAFAAFISHMVQMKRGAAGTVRVRVLHLYPTWFRWNLWHSLFQEETLKKFISHMVQMKLSRNLHDWKEHNPIYIPHGSDETSKLSSKSCSKTNHLYPTWFRWNTSQKFSIQILEQQFISHMVQMKLGGLQMTQFLKQIYIPHGSDETYWKKQIKYNKSDLYPTWFRWNK